LDLRHPVAGALSGNLTSLKGIARCQAWKNPRIWPGDKLLLGGFKRVTNVFYRNRNGMINHDES